MSQTKRLLTQDEINALDLGITIEDYQGYKNDMAIENTLFNEFVSLTRKQFNKVIDNDEQLDLPGFEPNNNNQKGDK